LLFCDTKERGQVDFKNSLNWGLHFVNECHLLLFRRGQIVLEASLISLKHKLSFIWSWCCCKEVSMGVISEW
jgi:hypothetical protein